MKYMKYVPKHLSLEREKKNPYIQGKNLDLAWKNLFFPIL